MYKRKCGLSVQVQLYTVSVQVPPCANLENPDPEICSGLQMVMGQAHRSGLGPSQAFMDSVLIFVVLDYIYICREAERKEGRSVLKNSFGFGGTNVSLLFRA